MLDSLFNTTFSQIFTLFERIPIDIFRGRMRVFLGFITRLFVLGDSLRIKKNPIISLQGDIGARRQSAVKTPA